MTAPPPYLAIADALRRRIESGDLAPGALLPSTRALAREHDVALATAAHALRTLANEGLVQGVPRFGTIVTKPRGRGARPTREVASAPRGQADAAPGAELSRERIVQAAMAIADREGLSALSLRGVAAKLDVPVMSLYRHVKSKEELLRELIDAALGEARLPDVVPAGWRAQLEVAARAQWATFRRHPWLARLMSLSRPQALASAIAHAEWILRALEGHGLDAAARMRMHIILFGFVQGLAVNLETEGDLASETGMTEDDWMRTQHEGFAALAASGRFPVFAALLGELQGGFDLDFDQVFELGLATLLDGFTRVLEGA